MSDRAQTSAPRLLRATIISESLIRRALSASPSTSAIAAGVCTFVTYLICLGPDFFWRDSGELTAAAYQLGSAHPTGFPVYCLVGKLFALLPFGSIAFRLNLLSAVAGSVAVGLTFKLVHEIVGAVGTGWPAQQSARLTTMSAATAAALLGISHIFWRQSTVAEVYTLTSAWTVACLLLWWRVCRYRFGGTVLALALMCGLGATGLHATFRLEIVLPLIVAWIIQLRKTPSGRMRLAPFAFLLGACVAAYLPLVSGRGPAADWGHPNTLSALWDHLTASRIRQAYAHQIASTVGIVVWENLKLFLWNVWDQLLGLSLGLSVLGCLPYFRKSKSPLPQPTGLMLSLLLWITAASLTYSFWLNPMGIRDLQNGMSLILALAIMAGLGLGRLAKFVASDSKRLAVAVGGAVFVMTVLPPLLNAWEDKVRGADYGASTWCSAALRQVPPQALVLTASDDLSGGLAYLQTVEDARPDVASVVRQHAWDGRYLRDVVRRADHVHLDPATMDDIARRPRKARQRALPGILGELVRRNRNRGGVYWEPGDGTFLRAAGGLNPGLPLFRVAAGPPQWPGRLLIDRTRQLMGGFKGRMSRRVTARHLDAAGRQAYRIAATLVDKSPKAAGRLLDLAFQHFQEALKYHPGFPPPLVNLGATAAMKAEIQRRNGKIRAAKMFLDQALIMTRQALALDPLRGAALVNAARYMVNLSDLVSDKRARTYLARAKRFLKRAERIGPPRASTMFLLGIVAAKQRRFKEARRYFEKTLKRDFDHAAARHYLKKLP